MVVPLFYRVYRSTVQRVAVSIRNLNSNAAFLVVLEDEKKITLWVGMQCDEEDSELAYKIAETIMKRDFRESEEEPIPSIVEGEETNEVLEPFLDLLWSSINLYYSKATAAERKKALVNSSVSVGLIEPMGRTADVFDFQETAFAHPDSNGLVPRVTFVPIEMKTIAYVNVGDHWDIWCARAVPDNEIERVMVFVRNTVATQLNLIDNAATRQTNVLGQYVHLVRQGEESTLFRRPLKIFTDYEPPGKCAPRPDSAPRMKKDLERKALKLHLSKGTDSGDAGKNAAQSQDAEEAGSAKGGVLAKQDSEYGFGGDANAPPPPPEAQRPTTVDFWSVPPTREPASRGDEDLVYPMINMTVTIKDKDGVYGIDPACVDGDMLRQVEMANDNPTKRLATIEEAARVPRSLIGYQIEIDDGVYAGTFVVTQVKKTLLHKTMFHLCALDSDRFWVRLKRNKKSGVAFRPLRRVVKVQFVDEKKSKADAAAKKLDEEDAQAVQDNHEGYQESSAFAPESPVALAGLGHSRSQDESPEDAEAAEYALILNHALGDE